LRRYVDVDREGNFQVKGDLRILYSVMLFIRVQIVASLGGSLLKGLLIGARYAVVRRQFSTVEGSKIERKLMDYQTHQFKYIPLLAYAVAFTFAGQELTKIYG
jgi:acyl-CoA oxidase